MDSLITFQLWAEFEDSKKYCLSLVFEIYWSHVSSIGSFRIITLIVIAKFIAFLKNGNF